MLAREKIHKVSSVNSVERLHRGNPHRCNHLRVRQKLAHFNLILTATCNYIQVHSIMMALFQVKWVWIGGITGSLAETGPNGASHGSVVPQICNLNSFIINIVIALFIGVYKHHS